MTIPTREIVEAAKEAAEINGFDFDSFHSGVRFAESFYWDARTEPPVEGHDYLVHHPVHERWVEATFEVKRMSKVNRSSMETEYTVEAGCWIFHDVLDGWWYGLEDAPYYRLALPAPGR